MEQLVKKYRKHRFFIPVLFSILLLLLVACGFFIYKVVQRNQQILVLNTQKSQLFAKDTQLSASLSATQKEYLALKNQDQYKINQQLKAEIDKVHGDYKGSIDVYQQILDLQVAKQDTSKLIVLYASVVKNLADLNYASADAQLNDLTGQIKKINDALAAAAAAAAASAADAAGGPPPAVNNTAPSSGYSFQAVQTDGGTFSVSIISGDLGSTRVVVDTASDSDCHDGCPVLSLGDYVARSGAYAGINGTYFCPASYPSCAGKTNSFDLLVMNKNKHYLNSDNNVYSNNPAFIFSGGGVRVVGAASQWGRDTGVDAVISNYPLLVSGGNIVYSDSPDPKFNSKGPRGFVAHKGNTVFIGDVYNATMGESAKVMKVLGMDDAMNLDEGGSTALWFGGYKAGPGRAIPNALLFVRR